MTASSIRRYKMDHPKQGYLIIIDNHTFPDPKNNLNGSEINVDTNTHTHTHSKAFQEFK